MSQAVPRTADVRAAQDVLLQPGVQNYLSKREELVGSSDRKRKAVMIIQPRDQTRVPKIEKQRVLDGEESSGPQSQRTHTQQDEVAFPHVSDPYALRGDKHKQTPDKALLPEDKIKLELSRGSPMYDIQENPNPSTDESSGNEDFGYLDQQMMPLDVSYSQQTVEKSPSVAQIRASRTIHILGVGPTGRFVAHAMASLSDRPAITILMHRDDIHRRWLEEGQLIEVLNKSSSDVQGGFDVESPTKSSAMIEMLIVSTRPSSTVRFLRMIRHRLGPASTICFLQNSPGVLEEVAAELFPDALNRPRFILGVSSHLLVPAKRAFTTEQKNEGEILLSSMPQEIRRPGDVNVRRFGWTTSSRKMMRNLTRSTQLKATGRHYNDLLKIAVERLLVSSVIEPLTVIFDCACGDLLSNPAATRLVQGILAELVDIARAFPEFQASGTINVREDFGAKRIEYLIFQYAMASKSFIPPMLQEIRKGHRSEIEYLNGYFLKRAEDWGMRCPVNNMIVTMVKAREIMMRQKLGNYIAWESKTSAVPTRVWNYINVQDL